MSEHNTITIDNYTFRLIRQTNHTQNYNHVVEISVFGIIDQRIFPNFWVYQSNSELGFWRLCYINIRKRLGIEKTPFHKGENDYIQSTFIHLELQFFINENIHNIPFVELSPREKEEQKFCFYGWSPKIMDREEDELPYIDEVIDDDNRIILEEPFNLLNEQAKCGFTGDMSNSYIEELLNIFSVNFSDTFNILETRLLYEYKFNFGGIINSNNNIFSIELSRKNPNETYKTNNIILYFVMTELMVSESIIERQFIDNIIKICDKKYHIFPFLLIPQSSSINYLGIYTHFIPCGIYICKLFDYHYQCSLEEQYNNRCTESYSYIGNRYDNLFPLNEVLPTLISCPKKGGTKKKTHKRKQKNTKKRKHKNTKKRKYNY